MTNLRSHRLSCVAISCVEFDLLSFSKLVLLDLLTLDIDKAIFPSNKKRKGKKQETPCYCKNLNRQPSRLRFCRGKKITCQLKINLT